MPELSQVTYSQTATVAAVRDYYQFISKLYLDENRILEPPAEGWPTITAETLADLDKTDEVISLLRHLPYIRKDDDGQDVDGIAWTQFADWQADSTSISNGEGEVDCESLKMSSEGVDYMDSVPSHVIGLTASGESDNPTFFLLDTEQGVVYWPQCPDEIKDDDTREQITDDPYDYAPEEEAEWRAEGAAWAIADFFEMLKDQFRKLNFIPFSSSVVKDVWTEYRDGSAALVSTLQGLYRQHGWPDLQAYRKDECLDAVEHALQSEFPDQI